jgi:hypothetical protein
MELLKQKIDKTAECTKLFLDNKWTISFDQNECFTPNSSTEELDLNVVIDQVDNDNTNIKHNTDIKCVNDNKYIEDTNNIEDSNNNTIVKDITNSLNIKKIDKKDISPLLFFKESLELYDDNETIKTKLFNFISTQKITTKYTKRGVSMIMDGIAQDKWNIYICKLFSFLLDISFEYRKQNICETTNSKFLIKK